MLSSGPLVEKSTGSFLVLKLETKRLLFERGEHVLSQAENHSRKIGLKKIRIRIKRHPNYTILSKEELVPREGKWVYIFTLCLPDYTGKSNKIYIYYFFMGSAKVWHLHTS